MIFDKFISRFVIKFKYIIVSHGTNCKEITTNNEFNISINCQIILF